MRGLEDCHERYRHRCLSLSDQHVVRQAGCQMHRRPVAVDDNSWQFARVKF